MPASPSTCQRLKAESSCSRARAPIVKMKRRSPAAAPNIPPLELECVSPNVVELNCDMLMYEPPASAFR